MGTEAVPFNGHGGFQLQHLVGLSCGGGRQPVAKTLCTGRA
jgi:hypothetical protein